MPQFDFSLPMDSPEDDGRIKSVYLSNSQEVVLESRDPYGFWHIRFKEGRTPDILAQQSFTGFTAAKQALEKFIHAEKFNVKISEVKVEAPVLQMKQTNKKA